MGHAADPAASGSAHAPLASARASMAVSAVSGAVSGSVSTLLLHPLDVAKTAVIAPNARHRSALAALRSIRRSEGLARVWRGVTPAVARISLGSGVYFTAQSALLQRPRARESLSLMVIGACARAAAIVTCCPISVVKTKLEGTDQAATPARTATQHIRHIYATKGVRGFYAGLGPSLLKDVPYAAAYLLVYKRTKDWLDVTLPSSCSSPVSATASPFVSAFVSAALVTTVLQPAEVVKTRMQLAAETRGVSAWQVLQRVLATRGPLGLFAGLAPRVARRSLGQCWQWGTFETIHRKVAGTIAV